MLIDDVPAPRTLYAVDLTVTADPAASGRVILHVSYHGRDPVALVIPDRPDQVEWFDPNAQRMLDPTPHVMWTAWRSDNAGFTDESRPTAAQRASNHVTLGPGETRTAGVDLGLAVEGLLAPRGFAGGWCVRAWLVGGTQPVSSNVVCWPAAPTP